MNEVCIRKAGDEDRLQWDDYVLGHAEAWPYHLWAWKESIESAYGHNGVYIIAEQDGEIRGVLPLIHMKLPILQNQLVSLPFCDLAGPLADSPAIANQLREEAVKAGHTLGAKTLEIRSRPQPNKPNNPTNPINKVSMLLPLPASSEELWNGFKSKLRSQVRKAEKNGLSFVFQQNVADFYTVFGENMRDLGSPVHSRAWIESVFRCFGKNVRMGLVYHDNKPIGAGLILTCGKKVSIPWASTMRAYNQLNPNMLLYWNFLKYAADNDYATFDFGRSTLNEGTYRFKSQWGAEPYPLQWHNIIVQGSGKVLGMYQDNSAKREIISKWWSKLPLPVANLIGPLIRRYISL
jgi:FemAB-related protein (PEP-CTERM system-associated)